MTLSLFQLSSYLSKAKWLEDIHSVLVFHKNLFDLFWLVAIDHQMYQRVQQLCYKWFVCYAILREHSKVKNSRMEHVPIRTSCILFTANKVLIGTVHCYCCLGGFLLGTGFEVSRLLSKGLLQFLHLQREVHTSCCLASCYTCNTLYFVVLFRMILNILCEVFSKVPNIE